MALKKKLQKLAKDKKLPPWLTEKKPAEIVITKDVKKK